MAKRQRTPSVVEQLNELHRTPLINGQCMYPEPNGDECGQDAISSHSLQNATVLASVLDAKNRAFVVPRRFGAIMSGKGTIHLQRLSRSQISIFPGFCNTHDTALFRPIEEQGFTGTLEQAFLHSYRGLCFELHSRRAHVQILEDLEAREQGNRGNWAGLFGFVRREFEIELQVLESRKRQYDTHLNQGRFDAVTTVVVELGQNPPVVCSGGFYPESSPSGLVIQQFSRTQPNEQMVTVSSALTPGGAAVLFSCLEGDQVACGFLNLLESFEPLLMMTCVRSILLGYLENVAIAPGFWASLPADIQNLIEERLFHREQSPGPGYPKLAEDRLDAHLPLNFVRVYRAQ